MLGLKILVADDELHILQVVEYKLAAAGYRVTTASCGASALHAARLDPPDVLITDLQMPNLNGLELCTHLYSDAASAGLNPIPAILLTARSHDLESLGIAVPPNLKRIVSKPFSPRQLVLAVREVTGEATGNATGNSQGHAPGEAA